MPALTGPARAIAITVTTLALAAPASAGGGLGASIPLSPVTKHSRCKVRGPLPDHGCTPGTRFRLVAKAQVCTPGYAGRVRNVPQSRKDAVYAAYGMTTHFNGHNGEVDHLLSRGCLAGLA